MALYVLDDPEAGYVLQTLIKQNTFVVYNEFDKSYKIRNLLQEFFMLRAKFLNIDFQPLYKRAENGICASGSMEELLNICIRPAR